MPVNELSQLTRKNVVLVTAFVLALISPLVSALPANAVTSNLSVYISKVDINLDSTGTKHVINISGEVLNASGNSVRDLTINLGSKAKLSSRENLKDFLELRNSAKLTETKFATKLAEVPGNTKKPWQITFLAEDIFDSPDGLYGFGVIAKTNKPLGTDVVAIPVFTNIVKPINTVLAIQLSTLNTHLPSGGISPKDGSELNRLTKIVEGAQNLPVSWVVDPSLSQWLKDLQTTELSAQANKLQELINVISPNVTPSLYSQPDVASMVASNREDDLSTLVGRSGEISGLTKLIYAPNDGRTSNKAITKLGELGVQPVLSNEFVNGSKFKTTQPFASFNGNSSLIYDAGLSDCLETDLTDAVTEFRNQNCVLSNLSFMAFEQSNLANSNALLLTPLNWETAPNSIANLVSKLSTNSAIQIAQLNSQLTTAEYIALKMPTDLKVKSFSSALIKAGDQITTGSAKISSMFLDGAYLDAFTLARLRGFSSQWASGNQAIDFLKQNEDFLSSYQNAVSIEASRTITVSNVSTQVPITVVNSSDRDLSIVVQLSSPQATRFTSSPSQVVSVPSGKRVTIPMDITLTGKGILNVTANLFAPNGQKIGDSKLIQISSAEYQGFARTLVLVAFGLLVLLSISNIVKRRRGTLQR